jgi:hypothetical protein
VIVRLFGVLSHFIYLEDARNHKPKIHTRSGTEIYWETGRLENVGVEI